MIWPSRPPIFPFFSIGDKRCLAKVPFFVQKANALTAGGWCGTSVTHCIGPNKWAPCQQKYGKCEIIRPRTCGEGSGTSDQRMIGYYQASNIRNRACNRIYPKDIKTDGYTHLYWAFATIDPQNFSIKAWEEADKDHMREFTALKGKGKNLKTWIAVGGFDFSDPGPTRTTWSDLCADPLKRADFIRSARDFMFDYGFQGIDLDWEYPGTDKRGGNPADLENFVSLLRDMKKDFGTDYGISLTLAPDYWYLRHFDVKGLEPFVDHFGFMSYDLHGFWDADVKTLGSIVRGQADIREIRNNTLPLAYAGVDPSKIVFGVAWYGRGYTLSDASCNTFGCPFAGPSRPGKCTNSPGVLSLVEIQQMINKGEATSRLNEGAAMKELVWDDQWVGYDDEETVALKKKFANDQCFGGIMAWSVDFNSGIGDGDDKPPISTDGKCGPKNGGATCEGTKFGDCCSSSGWCGSGAGHCGTDCISGKCIKNGISTNGRCGKGFNNAKCVLSGFGSCCSSGGWCGSSTSHCGNGCQSGLCSGSGNGNIGDTKPPQKGEAGKGDDEEEGEGPDDPELMNRMGTYLKGWLTRFLFYFSGCSREESNIIARAYKDANRLANQDKVKSNIQFDGPEAEDWFGPESEVTMTQRQQIQAVFANVATVSDGSFLNPFKWSIIVRCKEAQGRARCRVPLDTDPCRPPRRPWERSTTAYSKNGASYNNPEITFCPAFFLKPSLDAAITAGRILPSPYQLDIGEYQNTAETFLHELMHLWLASDSKNGSPNPYPDDLKISYAEKIGGIIRWPTIDVYGPALAKLLARYEPIDPPNDPPAGFYTQRNAENYAYYALMMYIEKELGVYPYLPLVFRTIDLPPTDRNGMPIFPPSMLRTFSDGADGKVVGNAVDGCDNSAFPQSKPSGDKLVTIEKLSSHGKKWHELLDNKIKSSTATDGSREAQCRPSSSLTAHETDIRFVVDKLCTNKAYWDKQIVPAISQGDGVNKAQGASESILIHGGQDRVWAGLGFAGGSCSGSFKFAIGNNDEEKIANCKAFFEPAVTQCRFHNTLETYGGSVQSRSCRLAQIDVVPANADDPTGGPMGGDMKCEDYKIDPKFANADQYKDTCRCWLTSNPKATDVFKKPKGTSKCSDIKKRLIPFTPGFTKRADRRQHARESVSKV
ncbi:hypothetical protein QQS21_006342 [Conoideocrella luteorostrata]|uniref:chitinase n=1 Tax=Conoideocrella luteorostrata TaxID=1105319 RepID=A0AAJ0CNS0_9HYPO|nr:hypothetical protein QQS21_006342 [Conoideocrella luteorostrata]